MCGWCEPVRCRPGERVRPWAGAGQALGRRAEACPRPVPPLRVTRVDQSVEAAEAMAEAKVETSV